MSASREYENRWVRQTDRQEAALLPEDRQDMRVRQAGHAGWEGQDSSACWLGRQELRVWTQHVRDDLVNCGILERRFGALGVRVPVEDPKCQVTITG